MNSSPPTVREFTARAPVHAQFKGNPDELLLKHGDYPVEVHSESFKTPADAFDCLQRIIGNDCFKLYNFPDGTSLRIEVPGRRKIILITFYTPDQNGQLTPAASVVSR